MFAFNSVFVFEKRMLQCGMVKFNKIQPLFDRVLLCGEVETKSPSGLVIPREALERSQFMSVIAVGDGACDVKVGERVIVAKYAGTEIVHDGEKFLLVKQCEILAIVAPKTGGVA